MVLICKICGECINHHNMIDHILELHKPIYDKLNIDRLINADNEDKNGI